MLLHTQKKLTILYEGCLITVAAVIIPLFIYLSKYNVLLLNDLHYFLTFQKRSWKFSMNRVVMLSVLVTSHYFFLNL